MNSPRDAKSAIDQLCRMGYLKYVSPAQVSSVRAQLSETLAKGYLDSEWDEALVSADRRTYPADSEELAEGNFGEILILMKPVLKSEGVVIGKIEDQFAEDGYRVLIDGTLHLIYDRSEVARKNVWALATKRFLEIVNGMLEEARSPERLWGVYGGNDGRFHLLTEEIWRFISQPLLGLDQDWMPYPSTDERLSE